jgi:hypothetical protein
MSTAIAFSILAAVLLACVLAVPVVRYEDIEFRSQACCVLAYAPDLVKGDHGRAAH